MSGPSIRVPTQRMIAAEAKENLGAKLTLPLFNTDRQQLPQMDSLRAIAVVAVLVQHWFGDWVPIRT